MGSKREGGFTHGFNSCFAVGCRLTLGYSSRVKVNLITPRMPGLDAVWAALCVHYFHNSECAHASHSIREQQTLYHMDICTPTNRHPWGRLSVRFFPWS